MPRKKIFNDPVYGFISIPYGILYDLIEHPYFQRLRRIRQLGLTDLVYSGAIHTRFAHAIGALHLMDQSISVLRSKGTEITPQEAEGVMIAILLHDIGHGPISHALEHQIVKVHHEQLSIIFMEKLNTIYKGRLNLAIRIFNNDYPKKFLYQLVSGQLDMDRMDYLNRDSFFTGVSEGVIGYHRIIKMLAVRDNELVVEEKGIYSIEKFLVARRLMYWQAYLHKTVLGAEQMLIKAVERARVLIERGLLDMGDSTLGGFLGKTIEEKDFLTEPTILSNYASLDDTDIMQALKSWCKHDDVVLKTLSDQLINRKLFKVELLKEQPSEKKIIYIEKEVLKLTKCGREDLPYFIIQGSESNQGYNSKGSEIKILMKSGDVKPFSTVSEGALEDKINRKYYLCYPKNIKYLSVS